MTFRIITVVFSFLLLGAHFSRADNTPLAIICILLPLFLLVKKRWIPVLLQCLLYLGGLIWVHATVQYVRIRMAEGSDWVRLVFILGSVSLFTIVAGLLLNSKVIKERYDESEA